MNDQEFAEKMQRIEERTAAIMEALDLWVKHINGRMSDFEKLGPIIKESMINTEHNYEITQEIRSDIEDLKSEIKLIKIIQLTMLKQKPEKAKK